MIKRNTAKILTLFFAVNVISSCGTIMTEKQKQLYDDVADLKNTSSVNADRISDLEKFGAESALAETGARIDTLSEDSGRVQGEIDVIKDDLKNMKESIALFEATLFSLEQSITKATMAMDNTKEKEELADLKTKVNELEEKIANIKTGTAAATEEKKPEAKELYMKGYRLVNDKEFIKGKDALKEFLKHYPDHDLSDNAMYWLGEAYYAIGDYERAILTFDDAMKKYPKADKFPAYLLKEAFSFSKLGANKEAKVLLKRLVEKYPKTAEAKIAKKRLKEMEEKPKKKPKKK